MAIGVKAKSALIGLQVSNSQDLVRLSSNKVTTSGRVEKQEPHLGIGVFRHSVI